MNRLGDTSAFVIPAGQLLSTRQGKTRMYTVGIIIQSASDFLMTVLSVHHLVMTLHCGVLKCRQTAKFEALLCYFI